MGQAESALKAAQLKSKFDNAISGEDDKKGPDPEEQAAKERMREERDRRNKQEYADKKANHAKNKKRLSAAWADHKKANQAK